MSGATAEVLQEYLVKLGFQTDQISLKKFEDGMGKTGKSMLKIGMGVAGVVASVEAASAAFAYSMRKTFFAAELADTSVKKMQAMSYAGKQFGISGDSMASSIKGMAQALRLNPGIQGLVESFGIPVTGRDKADVMMDFVKAIKDMPEFVGNQYASMFGMDADTFHQVREHFDEIIAKRKELSQLQKESGIDIDKQKQNILAYTSAMDKLRARFDLFATTFLSSMSPVFAKTVTWLDHIIEGWTWAFTPVAEKKSAIAAIKAARHAGKQDKAREGTTFWQRFKTQMFGSKEAARGSRSVSGKVTEAGAGGAATPSPGAFGGAARGSRSVSGKVTEGGSERDKLAALEKQYGLPAGLLWGQYGAESGFGKNLKSSAGAEGPFQFMPKTAKEYGLNGNDVYDFDKSSEAAARKMKGLLKTYGGDTNKALAGYNYGEGNIARMRPGQSLPSETQGYIEKVNQYRLGATGGSPVVTQNNTTNINVTGTGAEATAKEVARLQSRVNADAVRTLKSSTS